MGQPVCVRSGVPQRIMGIQLDRGLTANPGIAHEACRHSPDRVASARVHALSAIPVSARALGCKCSPSAQAD